MYRKSYINPIFVRPLKTAIVESVHVLLVNILPRKQVLGYYITTLYTFSVIFNLPDGRQSWMLWTCQMMMDCVPQTWLIIKPAEIPHVLLNCRQSADMTDYTMKSYLFRKAMWPKVQAHTNLVLSFMIIMSHVHGTTLIFKRLWMPIIIFWSTNNEKWCYCIRNVFQTRSYMFACELFIE